MADFKLGDLVLRKEILKSSRVSKLCIITKILVDPETGKDVYRLKYPNQEQTEWWFYEHELILTAEPSDLFKSIL